MFPTCVLFTSRAFSYQKATLSWSAFAHVRILPTASRWWLFDDVIADVDVDVDATGRCRLQKLRDRGIGVATEVCYLLSGIHSHWRRCLLPIPCHIRQIIMVVFLLLSSIKEGLKKKGGMILATICNRLSR